MYALLVTVLTLAALHPGQNQGQTRNPKNQAAQAGNTTFVEVPVVPQVPTPPSEQTPNGKKDDSEQKPKPWMSHSEWVMSILTFIYVVATIFYVVISIRTLGTIQRHESERTVVERSRERPWLLITLKDELFFGLAPDPNLFSDKANPGVHYNWYVTNHGRTPAIIIEVSARFEAVDSKEFDSLANSSTDYGETTTFFDDSVIVAPNAKHDWAPEPLTPLWADEELKDVHRHKTLLIAYGFVKYKDVIGQQTVTYESRFIACWRFSGDLYKGKFFHFASFGDYTRHT